MLTVYAPAKLNLSLDIVGTANDGYHLLRSVMKTISLYDIVKLEKSDTVSLSCNQKDIPTGKDNLVCKAAETFFKYTGVSGGVSILLDKNIPFGAGLGGGSSDAAATLMGLNQLYNTDLSPKELAHFGVSIGADVPFFIYGGTALIEGIGEKHTKLNNFMPCWFVVVKPDFSVSTPKAYQMFDSLDSVKHPNTDGLITAINNQDLVSFCRQSGNVLEDAVNMPEISLIKNRLCDLGAVYSAMTGSGSAVFGIFSSEETAKQAECHLKKEGANAFLCR